MRNRYIRQTGGFPREGHGDRCAVGRSSLRLLESGCCVRRFALAEASKFVRIGDASRDAQLAPA